MQVLASQLHFLANRNVELAILPLFWPANCIKIGGHVALLSDPILYSLYCAFGLADNSYLNNHYDSFAYQETARLREDAIPTILSGNKDKGTIT